MFHLVLEIIVYNIFNVRACISIKIITPITYRNFDSDMAQNMLSTSVVNSTTIFFPSTFAHRGLLYIRLVCLSLLKSPFVHLVQNAPLTGNKRSQRAARGRPARFSRGGQHSPRTRDLRFLEEARGLNLRAERAASASGNPFDIITYLICI